MYSAMIRFLIKFEGEERKEINIALNHDVLFVTAHPCVPSPYMDILKSPSFLEVDKDRVPKSTSGTCNNTIRLLRGNPKL